MQQASNKRGYSEIFVREANPRKMKKAEFNPTVSYYRNLSFQEILCICFFDRFFLR